MIGKWLKLNNIGYKITILVLVNCRWIEYAKVIKKNVKNKYKMISLIYGLKFAFFL